MTDRQRRIRRISRLMKFSAYTVAVLLPVLYATAFVVPEALRDAALMVLPSAVALATSFDLVVVFGIGAVPLALVVAALLATARLFALFEIAGPLSPEAGRLLGRIGLFVVLSQVAKVFASSAALAFVTWRAGEGVLAISIGSTGMVTLLFGALLLVLGWVLCELADVVDDHRQIV